MFKAILDAETDNERWLHQVFKQDLLASAIENKNKEAIDLIIEYSTKIPIVEKVEQYEGLDVVSISLLSPLEISLQQTTEWIRLERNHSGQVNTREHRKR